MTTPFPFVGAGEARYFEWAELHVYFTRAAKPDERAKIAKRVPKPLADSADWGAGGKHLYVASGQGVGREIEAAYTKPPKPPAKLTTTSRFKIASSSRVARFNADTVRWLEEIHAIVPILVAFRRQDWEAGGTTLSPWHAESVATVPALLKRIGQKPKPRSALASLIEGLTHEHAEYVKPSRGPDAAELVDQIMRAMINKPDLKAGGKLVTQLTAIESPAAWWLLADTLADNVIVCARHNNLLGNSAANAFVLDIFKRTLVGITPKAHAAAFQFRIDDGYQPWRLQRIIAVALEAAARAGDARAFAHFAKGVDKKSKDQRSELERCAEELDERALPKLAVKLRSVAPEPVARAGKKK